MAQSKGLTLMNCTGQGVSCISCNLDDFIRRRKKSDPLKWSKIIPIYVYTFKD